MAPSLRVLSDGGVRRLRHVIEAVADIMGLSAEQREALIPSGQSRYINRGSWALAYLNRAGAVERPSRGHYQITDIGRKLLDEHPDGITERHLRELTGDPSAPDVWKAFPAKRQSPETAVIEEESHLEPEEQIAAGVARIHEDVASQLLTRILDQEPVFFEQAVLDLLMAMGYGGTEGSANRTKLSGDGGIDGVIDQDALGLSRVYVQAKRYAPDNIVGRPAIQAFVGALAGRQANQGVFITTSSFSNEAQAFTEHLPTRIVLINGERLTRLMIRYGVGVQVKRTVQIVEVDEDFFE